MKKSEIKDLRIWAALYSVNRQIDLRNILVKNDYIELSQFIQSLINLDYIEYTKGKYSLTLKGLYKMNDYKKTLNLKGTSKFVVPNFDVLIDSVDENDLYLF